MLSIYTNHPRTEKSPIGQLGEASVATLEGLRLDESSVGGLNSLAQDHVLNRQVSGIDLEDLSRVGRQPDRAVAVVDGDLERQVGDDHGVRIGHVGESSEGGIE